MAHGNVRESLRVSWDEIDRMTAAAASIRDGRDLAGRNLNSSSAQVMDRSYDDFGLAPLPR